MGESGGGERRERDNKNADNSQVPSRVMAIRVRCRRKIHSQEEWITTGILEQELGT